MLHFYFAQKVLNFFCKYLELLNIPTDFLKLIHFSIVPAEELTIILKYKSKTLVSTHYKSIPAPLWRNYPSRHVPIKECLLEVTHFIFGKTIWLGHQSIAGSVYTLQHIIENHVYTSCAFMHWARFEPSISVFESFNTVDILDHCKETYFFALRNSH
jgi:hypothetical protein